MGARTYLPTLIRILERVCKFVARYQSQINEHLTAPQQVLLGNVITACNIFIAALGILDIGD
jgi:hypothetical protein